MRALVVLLLLAGCPPAERSTSPQPVHTTALAMIEASPDLDGRPIGTSDARATVVILMASWCGHCRAELVNLSALRDAHPRLRVVGVNYKEHEEYDNRGNAAQLRAFVATSVPWLRVVPAGHPLFDALGRPPFVPAVWIYDHDGRLVEFFDRRVRAPPTLGELEAVLAKLGA